MPDVHRASLGGKGPVLGARKKKKENLKSAALWRMRKETRVVPLTNCRCKGKGKEGHTLRQGETRKRGSESQKGDAISEGKKNFERTRNVRSFWKKTLPGKKREPGAQKKKKRDHVPHPEGKKRLGFPGGKTYNRKKRKIPKAQGEKKKGPAEKNDKQKKKGKRVNYEKERS